jgi:hypothetical protein
MTSDPVEAPEEKYELNGLFVFGGGVLVLIIMIILLGSMSPRTGFYGVSLFLLFLCAYMMPTIIALSRHHRNRNAIAILDLFLGWTFVGWVIAFVWSFTAAINVDRPPQRLILWLGYAVAGAVVVTLLIAAIGHYLFSETAFLVRW